MVDLVTPDAVPQGWLAVLRGEDERGRPVVVVHEDSPVVRAVAAFDAVINNSDRKGSHLVREGDRLRGFDHGVSLHEDPKLRTVLWGFAGQPIADADLARITRVRDALDDVGSELRQRAGPAAHPRRGDRAAGQVRGAAGPRGIPGAVGGLAGHPVAAAVRPTRRLPL